MCGIAGIFNLKKSPDSNTVNRMLDSMLWRGPDARGFWSDDCVALGHLRLSIIDLDAAANQPMADESGSVIIFNGEIYNYIELRKELEAHYCFKTQSDTEVILAAYQVWGEECIHRFNGEWGFALYDARHQKVFLSRDRFGIKPLYYYWNGEVLMFASEIRALLAGGVSSKVPAARLRTFLRFKKLEHRYETLFEDIYPLEAGGCLSLDVSGNLRQWLFYGEEQLLSAQVHDNMEEAIGQFGEIFKDAVRLRFRADVPVGVLLSGGIDSSAITAVASTIGIEDVRTFSAIYPGSPMDESPYSSAVASRYNTRHHIIQPEPDDFFELFEFVVDALDSPTPSPVHVSRYLVLAEAAKHVTVVLEGQGADEAFGGYKKLYDIYRKHYEAKTGKPLLMSTLTRATADSAVPFLEELAEPLRVPRQEVKVSRDTLNGETDPYRVAQYDIIRNKLLSLLHAGDRLQMRNSIEGRCPFLDHRLVEFCFSAPYAHKMQDYDKYLLRKWLERHKMLPESVLYRRDKKGFANSHAIFLRESPLARDWMVSKLEDGLRNYPCLFNRQALMSLVSEQFNEGKDHLKRLLAAISLMIYLEQKNVLIT